MHHQRGHGLTCSVVRVHYVNSVRAAVGRQTSERHEVKHAVAFKAEAAVEQIALDRFGAKLIQASQIAADAKVTQPPRQGRDRLAPAAIAVRPGQVQDVHLANHRPGPARPEENTSELPSLMRTSYAVFCLTQHNNKTN